MEIKKEGKLEDVLAVVGIDGEDDSEYNEMNNISTFWGFVLKVHSFASPESDTDIIRNVAVTGTSGRMHCGTIKEL